MQKEHHHVIEQVPVDYYQQGVKNNMLQRIWHTRKLSMVLSFFPSKKNMTKKILDVGCASGWFLSEIYKAYPSADCYGIDIYDKAIKHGKKIYPHLKLSLADAYKLPYKDNFFDVVVCTEVLEHVDNSQAVLTEIKRVIKKDGVAIIELDSGSILFSVVWYVWRKFHGKVWNDAHLHSFNIKKLEEHVQQGGLRVLKKSKFNWGMGMIFSIKKYT